MDRRKAEAQGQLQTLKQECEITTELLNKLIQVCSKHVKDVEKLDSKSFRTYSKYFLAVLQFQSISVQKIIEWNIDLEEFLIENGPADLDHFKIINSTNKSSISLSESETKSSCISPISSSSLVPYTTKIESTLAINNTNVEINVNPEKNIVDEANRSLEAISESLSTSPSTDNTIVVNNDFQMPSSVLNDSISSSEYFCSVSSLNAEKNSDASSYIECSDFEENEKEKPKQTTTSSSEYFCSASSRSGDENPTEVDVQDISSFAECCSDLEEKPKQTTPSRNFYSLSSQSGENNPADADLDVSSYGEFSLSLQEKEKPKQSSTLSISERLKTLPIVSLQDRFLQSLPKAPMPDLSLRPVSEIQTAEHKKNNQLAIPANIYLTLEDIKAFESELDKNVTKSTVKEKTKVKELQEYKNTENLLEIEQRVAPKIGDTCMIGYVESPSEIYIQVADENSNSLDILSMQLFEVHKNSPFVFASKTVAINKLGSFWILNSVHNTYRVEVLDWMLNEKCDDVLVQLVDYGWKYIVNYKQLLPLPLQFRNIPRMAQLCHLGYLYPSGSTKNRRLKIWSDEEKNGLYEVLGDLDHTTFKIVHVYYCKQRMSYEIDLIKTDETNEESTIGQILVDYGLAVEIIDDHLELQNNAMKDQIRTAHGLNGITTDMSLDDVLETYFQQNVDEEAATLNEAVMHYDPKDEAETCRNLRRDGTCYKGKSCNLRHIPLRNGFTRDKLPVYDKAFEEDPLPCINDEVFMTISHIVDIQCFYAQIRRDNNVAGYPRGTLNSLIKSMNNPDMIKTYKRLRVPPSPCQMVIAKHWNTFWYRGQVRDVIIPEGNNEVMVEVYIVDFGDKLQVPMSDLRAITSDFLFMSFQAVECRLYNVKHKDGLDPIEERKHFESQYLGQNFKAKIMGVPGHLVVILENSNGEDIGLKLIEDGYGELNTDHFFPANNERILID